MRGLAWYNNGRSAVEMPLSAHNLRMPGTWRGRIGLYWKQCRPKWQGSDSLDGRQNRILIKEIHEEAEYYGKSKV
jgi:hypothetical protein